MKKCGEKEEKGVGVKGAVELGGRGGVGRSDQGGRDYDLTISGRRTHYG